MDRNCEGHTEPCSVCPFGPSVLRSSGPPVLLRRFAFEVRVPLQPCHVVRDEVVRVGAADVLHLRHLAAERLQQVGRAELHVVEHLGHRVAMHEVTDLVALGGEVDVHRVRVTEQVVQVAKDLLICAGEEHAEDVRLAVPPLVERQ